MSLSRADGDPGAHGAMHELEDEPALLFTSGGLAPARVAAQRLPVGRQRLHSHTHYARITQALRRHLLTDCAAAWRIRYAGVSPLVRLRAHCACITHA